MDEIMLWLQLVTAGFFALVVFAMSFLWLREEHRGGKPWLTHIGALIFGVLLGGFVAIVMVPLRIALMEGRMEMDSPDFLKWYLPAFAVFIFLLRTDVTARLPLIGIPIRAYRAALLRRQIAHAQKRLAKMERASAERPADAEGETALT